MNHPHGSKRLEQSCRGGTLPCLCCWQTRLLAAASVTALVTCSPAPPASSQLVAGGDEPPPFGTEARVPTPPPELAVASPLRRELVGLARLRSEWQGSILWCALTFLGYHQPFIQASSLIHFRAVASAGWSSALGMINMIENDKVECD
jgi:hypothetical protein